MVLFALVLPIVAGESKNVDLKFCGKLKNRHMYLTFQILNFVPLLVLFQTKFANNVFAKTKTTAVNWNTKANKVFGLSDL